MKKKILSLIVFIILGVFAITGCQTGSQQETESESATEKIVRKADIRIGGLKGPTSMGMVQLMEASEAGETFNNYDFTIAVSADELTPKFVRGELDIVAVPANLASVIYNNTEGAVELLAINTLGVNYIVEVGDTIKSMEDLRGKTIYATGKGAVPEFALRYLLTENGINPDNEVTIEWKSEPTEVVGTLSKGGGIAMMPQPFTTVAQTNVEGLQIALDMTEEWDKLENGSTMITGVLLVRKEFSQEYPDQLSQFLDEYKLSTEYVNENLTDGALLVEKYGIVAAAVAEKAIPYCNITFIEGSEMKTAMDGYLNVLFEQKPESVGGKLPDNEFYYER